MTLIAAPPSVLIKHLTAYLPSVPGTVRAEVLAPRGAGRKSLARVETQLSAPSGMAVAVVSDNPAALGQVGAISTLAATFGGQPQLVHVTTAGLPDSARWWVVRTTGTGAGLMTLNLCRTRQ